MPTTNNPASKTAVISLMLLSSNNVRRISKAAMNIRVKGKNSGENYRVVIVKF